MDSFESIRRLATTLGVSCPESSDNVFDVSFINSLSRAAKRLIKDFSMEIDKSNNQSEKLKTAYCEIKGADSTVGLDCCDDYKDWLESLKM